jgi:hypothetical protein
VAREEHDPVARNPVDLQPVGHGSKGAAREAGPLVHDEEAGVLVGDDARRELRRCGDLAAKGIALGADADRRRSTEARGNHCGEPDPDAADSDHHERAAAFDLQRCFRVGLRVEGVIGVPFGTLAADALRHRQPAQALHLFGD